MRIISENLFIEKMRFLSITVILVSLLCIQEFHSIDGSVEQIYEKVKQEVEDLIDSQEYESVNEIVKDSKVKVKYLDYYVPTKAKPTTTMASALNRKGNNGIAVNNPKTPLSLGAGVENAGEEGREGEEVRSNPLIFVAIAIVVVVVIIGVVIGAFIYLRGPTNKNIKKKPKKNISLESLSSIETVASLTGKPLHPKGKPAAGKQSKK